ncbi:MAG TPA: SDR family oxidoreductase [Oligoflexus sp.]|uniref:SDR family oxidoreductase n=1 Tax=Oligoflexus sp. TaxID=1971216 RepID=UPI002D6973D1|nr:SDR family oxidoreductase [Oligoflexus sp.]HYX39247.1 SDR family oxidoreductase [Oligoflexus sp.]
MRDLKGKTALVTGANGGIGLATAQGLAAGGANVILGCRNLYKAEEARAIILQRHPEAEVDVMALDLANIMNIKSAAEVLKRRHPRLDILINNAGVMSLQRQETRDGFELTFGVNHLGTFALTQTLLPLVTAAPQGRIVTLSSALHYRGHMHWEDLQYRARPYKGWEAYNQSKLANVLMTKALARRLASTNVRAFAVHPGVVATQLGRDYPSWLMKVAKVFMVTPEKGSRCTLFVATEPALDAQNGSYFEQSKAKNPAAAALSEEDQERLWKLSEQLTA